MRRIILTCLLILVSVVVSAQTIKNETTITNFVNGVQSHGIFLVPGGTVAAPPATGVNEVLVTTSPTTGNWTTIPHAPAGIGYDATNMVFTVGTGGSGGSPAVGGAGVLQASNGSGQFQQYSGASCLDPNAFGYGFTVSGSISCRVPTVIQSPARPLLTTPDTSFQNGVNLGAMTPGVMTITTSGGVATPSTTPKPTGNLVGTLGPQELANTRIDTRPFSVPTNQTPLIFDIDQYDVFVISDLQQNTTFGAPTGSAKAGQLIFWQVKVTATRNLTFDAAWTSDIGFDLPTQLVAGSTYDVFIWQYNAGSGKWVLIYNSQTFRTMLGDKVTAGQYLCPTLTVTSEGFITGIVAGSCADAGGGVPLGRTLTFNGTSNEIVVTGGTQDLQANRTWSVALASPLTLGSAHVLQGATPLVFDGATVGSATTAVQVTDPTANRTVTIPDANSTTVQADTGATNQFLTGINGSGVISKAQPSLSNLSDGTNAVIKTQVNTFSGAGALTGLPIPTNPTDVATKSYVDALGSGMSGRASVRAATTAALTASYSNGASGVGATLTNSGSNVAFALDGVSLATSDRVLIKNQATGAQNGIYTVTTVGNGATQWVLTRATDYDQSAEVVSGSYTLVGAEGTTNKNTQWIQTTPGTITIGTTALVFNQLATTSPPLTNIPDNTVLDNKLKATAVSPPSTPPTGFGYAYFDGSNKVWTVLNDAGVKTHDVQTMLPTTSQWLRSVDDSGLFTKSQPAFSDVSGQATASQVPNVEALNSSSPLPVGKGGTGVTDLTYGGTSHKAAVESGSFTAGHCLTKDVNGNIVTTGAPCGGGGGGGTANPAGSTGDVQYNDSGALAADTGQFNWDQASNTLTLAGLDLGGTATVYKFRDGTGFGGVVFPPLTMTGDLSYTWPSQSGELCVKGGSGCGGSGTIPTPAGDDQLLVSDSAVSSTWRTIPTCSDSGGNHLNYNAGTNTFTCGTSSSGAPSGDGAADGTTKGIVGFTAADFNSASGIISLDYLNGQAAAAGVKGFLTGTDWSTFNGKGDASTGLSTSVDNELALFSGTGGKTFKRATGTGLAKLTSGVQSTVTAPAGAVVGDTDTQTLTNKRVQPRFVQLTSAALNPSYACDFGANDQCEIEATNGTSGTLTVQAPTGGTLANGETRSLLFKCTVAQTFSWDVIFIDGPGLPRPTSCPVYSTSTGFFAVEVRYSTVLSKFETMGITRTTGDFSSSVSTSVDSEIVLYSGTGGKTAKRATGSGLATVTNGVLGTATAPTGTVVGTTDAQTLTNKRVTNRVNVLSTSSTFTCDSNSYDQCRMVMSGGAGTITIAAPSPSTPVDGDMLMYRLRCTGGTQTLSFNAIYVASPNVPLLTSCTVAGTATQEIVMGFMWSSDLSKWQLLATN